MDIIIPAIHQQLGDKCSQALYEFGLIKSGCLDLILSKLVGILIIGFSSISKLPQIWKVIKNKKTEGINLTSLIIETLALTIINSYCIKNLQPFTTFGDASFVLIQDILLLLTIQLVNKDYTFFILNIIINLILNYILFLQLTTNQVTYLMISLLPVSIIGIIPQLYENYSKQSIGQLAPTSIYIAFFNSLGRVFTNYIEVDDFFSMLGALFNFLVNCVLVYQVLTYSKSDKLDSKKAV